ncbi:MAG: Fic family protein [Deltaproteobacteria bacterium]|nr:Fic family protein [Deltaproteobacteria bacterium]
MLLDEIDRLKSEIDKLRPFEGRGLDQLKAYYRIGLTYTSNALEGNSLTESETKVLLEDGLTVGGKPLRDIYEATGHAKAYDHMYTLLSNPTITAADVLALHRLFYHQIDSSQAGAYRQEPVIISGSQYPTVAPSKIKNAMSDFFDWLSRHESSLHPVTFAAEAHKRFVFIHPFIDGNGRVARLLMNLCLLRRGYTIAIIPPVLRASYIARLEEAHVDDGPFMKFIAERVLETQRDLLRLF